MKEQSSGVASDGASDPSTEDPFDIRARLRVIVDSSEDAVVSKTLEGIVTSWNAGAERVFDWTSEEMVGQPILELIPEDLRHEEAGIFLCQQTLAIDQKALGPEHPDVARDLNNLALLYETRRVSTPRRSPYLRATL